jgi:acyl-CoA synthetase (AMP-forming)/AMP-acid ligase II
MVMKQKNGITMGDIIRRNAFNYEGKLGLIDVDKRLRFTFGQWNNRTNQCAQMLSELGTKKGDKVATWFFNQHEYLETRFGVGKLGAVTVPVNFRLAAAEMQTIVNHSDAEIFIFDQALAEGVDSVRSELKRVKHYIMVGEKGSHDWALNYEDSISACSVNEPEVEVFPEDIEAILYTSGTTGFPKGVVRTHSNAIWTALAFIFIINEGVPRNSIWINAMPLFHIAGFELCFLPIMMKGGTNILMRAFDPDDFLKVVETEKATGFLLVPTALSAIVDKQEEKGYDVSSLRFAATGAAPLSVAVKEKTERVLDHMKLYVFYGSTELGPPCGISPSEKRDFWELPCIGKGSICGDLRVLNSEGSNITPSGEADGEIGEIAAKGPIVLLEYYKEPAITEAAFTKDGFLLSGDLAKVDTLDNLYITGRSKEMIISGGENIYPIEVENVLFKYDGVEDATVIGIPHKKWGETPRAIVVLKSGYTASEEEIIKFCKSNLAGYKCPTSVVFTDLIPRSSSGKVQKYKLKETFGTD